MKTTWILCMTFFLLLAGCTKETPENEGGRTDCGERFSGNTFVWENQSDHTMRMIARRNYGEEEIVEFDCALWSFGFFSYTMPGNAGYYPTIESVWWSSMEVWFDGRIKVPYTLKPRPEGGFYATIDAPEDYLPSHNVMSTENYVKVTSVNEYSVSHNTYTYTFTNADYEAAKEWSEKQAE